MFSIRAICAVGLSMFCLVPVRTSAQTPAAAPAPPALSVPQIADSIKTSASLSQDDAQSIDQSVDQLTKVLADGSNPTAQSQARQWLIDGLVDSGGNPSGADFLQHYTHSVNAHLLAMVSAPNANFRAKIEAGLAAQFISQRTGTTTLAPLAIKLLQDHSPAVAWAGMKAASGLIPTIFAQSRLSPTDNQLVNEMIAAVGRNPDPPLGGSITEEAYQSFLAPVLNGQGNANSIAQVLVPAVMKLWQERIALYQNGAPDSPGADNFGMIILLHPAVWPNLPAAQQREVLKGVAELITQTAKLAADAKNNPGQVDAGPLVDALQRDGRELHQVFSDPARGTAPNQALYNATGPLAALGSGSGATAITTDSGAAADAINSLAAQTQ